MPILVPVNLEQVTCTLVFLIYYSNAYFFQIMKEIDRLPQVFSNDFPQFYADETKKFIKINGVSSKCKAFVRDKMQKCNKTSHIQADQRAETFYLYLFDLKIFATFNQTLFALILNPILSVVDFVLLVISIIALSNENLIDTKCIEMYKLLRMNFSFGAI